MKKLLMLGLLVLSACGQGPLKEGPFNSQEEVDKVCADTRSMLASSSKKPLLVSFVDGNEIWSYTDTIVVLHIFDDQCIVHQP